MTNRAKAQGTAWETRLVKYLQENGFPYAERRALTGALDRGDIAGIPLVCLEAKNARRHELAQWIDEVVKEKANAQAQIAAVVFPRRGHSAARAYVLMELQQFIDLIR